MQHRVRIFVRPDADLELVVTVLREMRRSLPAGDVRLQVDLPTPDWPYLHLTMTA